MTLGFSYVSPLEAYGFKVGGHGRDRNMISDQKCCCRSVTWLDQAAVPSACRTFNHERSLSLSTPGPAVDRALAAPEHPRR